MFSNSDLNKIKNPESRNSFDNVLQAFYSNNFNAAILLLYNLLVNDLYYKLVKMDEKGYVNCKQELQTINNMIKSDDDAKYSEVEKKIFDIYKDKRLLNISTIELLEYFKKTRNKCAHPFYFKETKYNPSKDQTYLFIIEIYSEILCIDYFFKNPYEVIKNDMVNFEFPDLESIIFGIGTIEEDCQKVRKYYERKYFKFMTDANFKKLFQSLIELTITKNSDEVIEEQYKHYLILRSLLEFLKDNNKINLLNNEYEWGKIEPSNIRDDSGIPANEQKCFSLSYLFRVVSFNEKFYEEIKDTNENLYDFMNHNLLSKAYLFKEFWGLIDFDINDAIKSFSPGRTTSIKKFKEYYNLIDSLKNILNKENIIALSKKMLSSIPTIDAYNEADIGMELFIKIISDKSNKISQEELSEIFEIMNDNCQIYRTSRNSRDNQIKRIVGLGYDLSKYEKLTLSEKVS